MTTNTTKRIFSLLMLCASLTLYNNPAVSQDTYVLNTSTSAPYATNERTGFQDLIVAEVFKRLGLKGQVLQYGASARALVNANKNVDQGVAMRIKGLEKKFPNLVIVDEPLIQNDFVAYSKNSDFTNTGWQSLKSQKLAYILGWVIFERNLDKDQVKFAVKEPHQMFTMLEKDRVDLILYERWQGLHHAKESDISVKVHEPPLASVSMYMYMHKDHADLVPKMADALRDMKTDGTYQSIFDRTLTVLVDQD